ncbi:hypothetical protein MKW94_005542 [Papaver nudicaule]|uniref:Glycosyltransferase n=1 Tax=Papaver nudicaule TaxID=74823 RepID=A0AA41SQZ5_PAPNU|nr:hypothetical protein [Papaver nudicaule]
MESSVRIKKQHLVVMQYPGRGHINPVMNFCKLLTTKFLVKDDIRITFVVIEEWLGFIESSSESRLPSQIQLRSIPNVVPSELVRGLDPGGFFLAVQTKMEDPFEKLMDQLQEDDDDTTMVVTTIIADTTLPWLVTVGDRRCIPVISLWPMSPSVFSIYNHLDLLVQNGHYPVDSSSECGDELVDYIAGVSPIRLADMPSVLKRSAQQFLSNIKESIAAAHKAKCLLFTTYHELEPQVIESLMKLLPLPIYSIGPSIPISIALADACDTTGVHNNMNMEEQYYLKWLGSQPENSVLYVSFGSFLSASSEQMEEILAGLRESGVRYLLVSRGGQGHANNSVADGDADNEMTNAQSLVVPWCGQLRVLCHSSVGGVYAGVPMLTFPVSMEQPFNSKLIVDDWKIGMRVMKENRMVKREEIAMTVTKFMNLNADDEESKEMRARANKFKTSSRQALANSGSSTTNVDHFIRNILQYHS